MIKKASQTTRESETETARPLRQEAEKRWRAERKTRKTPKGDEATLFELEVHQIELELQNEELRRTQLKLIEARDNYLNLYEFAPVGYLTLCVNRVIRQANLTASKLLGLERGKLENTPIEHFVTKDVRDALYMHLQTVRE